MASAPFNVPNYDANQLLSLVRALAGPVLTGTITADTPFVDAAGFPIRARWIYVGTTGNITYVKYDQTTQLLNNIAAGVWHPIHAIQVNSSGTTATGLVWGS